VCARVCMCVCVCVRVCVCAWCGVLTFVGMSRAGRDITRPHASKTLYKTATHYRSGSFKGALAASEQSCTAIGAACEDTGSVCVVARPYLSKKSYTLPTCFRSGPFSSGASSITAVLHCNWHRSSNALQLASE